MTLIIFQLHLNISIKHFRTLEKLKFYLLYLTKYSFEKFDSCGDNSVSSKTSQWKLNDRPKGWFVVRN